MLPHIAILEILDDIASDVVAYAMRILEIFFRAGSTDWVWSSSGVCNY